MCPSLRQLNALTSEDRVLYKTWLRHSLTLYAAIALIATALTLANWLLNGASRIVASNATLSAMATAAK